VGFVAVNDFIIERSIMVKKVIFLMIHSGVRAPKYEKKTFTIDCVALSLDDLPFCCCLVTLID
jgi:hypothetical protein